MVQSKNVLQNFGGFSVFTAAEARVPAALAAEILTPAASRIEGATVHYYATLHEAFEAAAGTSIDSPDEITVLSNVSLDSPIIIATLKHIRLVAADGSKTIQRGSGNLENPLFRLLGNSASLTLGTPGAPGMENELIIDGGYLNTPPIKALAPLIAVNGQNAKMVMYDNVFLQNNYNFGAAAGTSTYQNGSCVMLRTVDDDPENLAEFIMKGGVIRGNINNTQNPHACGAGVLIMGFALFTMEGGEIMNNTAMRAGGGFLTGSRGSFKKTGGIIYGSDAPDGYRNIAINGIGSPIIFGHAVCVPLTDDPVFQYRDDTVGENDFLSYIGSPTKNGIFGQGEKWEKPTPPHSFPWLIIVIASVLAIGGVVVFLVIKLKQQPIPAWKTIEPDVELSPREREIFDQLLTKLSTKEIARNMDLSYTGVTFHINKLYNKLGVQGRVEFLAKYVKKRTITPRGMVQILQ
jgi:DNA-binding CsgD family transcriptional regulator